MATWDDLKAELLRLEAVDGALAGYPDPRHDAGRTPPFSIRLAPWATDEAATLHSRFADEVELVVGALRYPSCAAPRAARSRSPAPDLDTSGLSVELDGPLTVKSGYTAHHVLLVHNATEPEVGIVTNRQVTATVVDPATGRRVGGFTGAQHLPRKVFVVAPGGTEGIPLCVGTASFVPDLGYAVPPGAWALQVTLMLADGRSFLTPALRFTVTA